MLTEQLEPSIQVRAYLKRMAQSYEFTEEAAPSEEIEALMDELRACDDDISGGA